MCIKGVTEAPYSRFGNSFSLQKFRTLKLAPFSPAQLRPFRRLSRPPPQAPHRPLSATGPQPHPPRCPANPGPPFSDPPNHSRPFKRPPSPPSSAPQPRPSEAQLPLLLPRLLEPPRPRCRCPGRCCWGPGRAGGGSCPHPDREFSRGWERAARSGRGPPPERRRRWRRRERGLRGRGLRRDERAGRDWWGRALPRAGIGCAGGAGRDWPCRAL